MKEKIEKIIEQPKKLKEGSLTPQAQGKLKTAKELGFVP